MAPNVTIMMASYFVRNSRFGTLSTHHCTTPRKYRSHSLPQPQPLSDVLSRTSLRYVLQQGAYYKLKRAIRTLEPVVLLNPRHSQRFSAMG